VSTAAALTALVAAITFSAGLTHLVDTPRLWGATWDVTTNVAADTRLAGGEFTLEETLVALQGLVERGLRSVDEVEGWSVASYQTIALDDAAVPSFGLEPGGDVRFEFREGRAPRNPVEVALGSNTLDQLGVEIGDTLTDGAGRRLRVVGVVVMPRVAAIGGADEAGVGDGAFLTLRGLVRAASDPYTRAYLLELEPGTDVDAAIRKITKATRPYAFNVDRPFRPSVIANLDNDVEGRPAILAAILGALGVGTLTHALVTSVTRRRRDLAILATLGFSRLQIATTVAWQATTVAFVALLVGIPLGIVGGRFATGWLADEYGTLSDPVVPWLMLAATVVGTFFVANVIAALPGYAAARTRPAAVLRSE
jgi:putative ABC transport system permease protein